MKTTRLKSTLALLLLTIGWARAQVTTSTLSGKIFDASGQPLPGATVLAKHVPTGTGYATSSNEDGGFNLPNLIPGGPYEISVNFIGFKTNIQSDIQLPLGVTTRINFNMTGEGKELNELVVTGNKDAAKTGAGTKISNEQIRQLPTLGRSLSDFTRLTPQAANNSFAGTSWRYNNVTVDGAINNDAIGFSPQLGGVTNSSNMPGSSTRTNSFSLDAIDQVDVRISPFDVTYGNFTGGSINAVTRRGTNQVTGSVYGFGRNAVITGPSNATDKSAMPSSYYDYQTGFRVGLPIVKDKLFLFTNIENTANQTPTFYNAGQSGSLLTVAQANQLAAHYEGEPSTFNIAAQTAAGKTPPSIPGGSLFQGIGGNDPNLGNGNNAFNNTSKSIKVFARLDWNINSKHQLAYRINYIPSQASYLDRSGVQYNFDNNAFLQHNIQLSNVLELKSRFTNRLSNQLIAGYTVIHDYRDPTAFGAHITPQIQIQDGNGYIYMGTDYNSAAFNQYQHTFELTDNLNYFWKNHKFTLGTHNEFYSIDFGLVNSWNGRFDYASIQDFLKDDPKRIRAFFNLTDNSHANVYNNTNPATTFNIDLLSTYLQDEWQVTNKLRITPGIRVDYTYVPTDPTQSTLSTSIGNSPAAPLSPNGGIYSFGNTLNDNNKIFGNTYISPRIGFNYDLKGDSKIIFRGGTGTFVGRVPFAWLGYAYYNNGTSYGALDFNPKSGQYNVPVAADPTQYNLPPQGASTSLISALNSTGPIAAGGTGKKEVDVIDPNFKMPYMWRSNFATDITLPAEYKLTLEGIYTKTLNDVMVQNINVNQNPTSTTQNPASVYYYSYDLQKQQPIVPGNISNTYSNVYLLTNTHQGYRYSLTAQLKKTYKFGFDWSAAYTYGQSKDVMNGVRNAPESSWQYNQQLNANNPVLGTSNFQITSIIVATAGFKTNWNKKNTSYASLVFTGQSGTPFTYESLNSITNYGTQGDLVYIPHMDNANGVVALGPNGKTPEIVFDDQINKATGAYDPTKYISPESKAFYNFVNGDSYLKSREGNFTERNGARTPWNNRLDLRLMHDFNFYLGGGNTSADGNAPVAQPHKHTLQLTWDIINITNLIDPKWGWYYFVPNTFNNAVDMGLTPYKISSSGLTVVNSDGTKASAAPTSTNGSFTPIYTFLNPTSTYTKDLLSSRWQMQIGVRYSF